MRAFYKIPLIGILYVEHPWETQGSWFALEKDGKDIAVWLGSLHIQLFRSGDEGFDEDTGEWLEECSSRIDAFIADPPTQQRLRSSS